MCVCVHTHTHTHTHRQSNGAQLTNGVSVALQNGKGGDDMGVVIFAPVEVETKKVKKDI